MTEVQPIIVSIEDARVMLGGIGKTTLYQWLDSERLESRKIGKRRFILVSSIIELIKKSRGN